MNKNVKKVLKTILIILDICLIVFLYIRGNNKNQNEDSTITVTEATAEKRTITKELTASGKIESANTEKLSLSTSKYFNQMCAEKDEYIKEGENILEYTNGTYLTAPYNLVITDFFVPETENVCTSENYIQVESLSETIDVKTYSKDNKFNLEIVDTGIGISDEAIKHVFERFYREDKAHARETGGNGLGLSIAYTMVQLHGGQISIHKNEPKGTKVIVRL